MLLREHKTKSLEDKASVDNKQRQNETVGKQKRRINMVISSISTDYSRPFPTKFHVFSSDKTPQDKENSGQQMEKM